jgi:hypothetical protein
MRAVSASGSAPQPASRPMPRSGRVGAVSKGSRVRRGGRLLISPQPDASSVPKLLSDADARKARLRKRVQPGAASGQRDFSVARRCRGRQRKRGDRRSDVAVDLRGDAWHGASARARAGVKERMRKRKLATDSRFRRDRAGTRQARTFVPHSAARRGVAQPGSALAWGASGRWFKSSRPDHATAENRGPKGIPFGPRFLRTDLPRSVLQA